MTPVVSNMNRSDQPEGYSHPHSKVRWAAVNWQLHDAAIAAQYGVSLQRVGQKRRQLGLPAVPALSRVRAALARDRADHLVRTHGHVAARVLSRYSGIPAIYVSEARRSLGLARGERRHIPRSLFNWELPNVDLAAIWRVREQYLSRLRGKYQLPRARWHRQRGITPTDPAYAGALAQEREKAGTVQQQWAALEETWVQV